MPKPAKTPFDDLDPRAVLRAAEIAERLAVDQRSVRRAISRGDLPASRACGIRVLAADAADWWRERMIEPRAPRSATAAVSPGPVSQRVEPQRPPRRRRRAAARPGDRLPLPARGGGS